MFTDLTAEQRALRDELRGYFGGLMTPAERAELLTERHGAVYRDVVRRMGRDGWLGVGWPERYGGRGFGQMEQQIFADEAARADVPLPAVTLQTVGPTLQEHGTPWQQDFFLPRILAGEVHFAIGYTEPARIFGRKKSCCQGVPCSCKVGPTVCRVTAGSGTSARAASSAKICCSTWPKPRPPYRRGQPTPSQPSRPIRCTTSR